MKFTDLNFDPDDYTLRRRFDVIRLTAKHGWPLPDRIKDALYVRHDCTRDNLQADLRFIALMHKNYKMAIPQGIRRAARMRDGNSCSYCWRKHESPALDHIVALTIGGKHTLGNLVTTCQSCNTVKGVEVWLPRQFDSLPLSDAKRRSLISRASLDCRTVPRSDEDYADEDYAKLPKQTHHSTYRRRAIINANRLAEQGPSGIYQAISNKKTTAGS